MARTCLVFIIAMFGVFPITSSLAPTTTWAQAVACLPGYVWRAARPEDTICVIPQSRALAKDENDKAVSRREANTGPDGVFHCLSGFVWRNAYEGDLTCVTPPARDRVQLENQLGPGRAEGGAPDFRAPGQHTLLFGVARNRIATELKTFQTPFHTCNIINFPGPAAGTVGWGQDESCGAAYLLELAIQFDYTLLDMIPMKIFDRIVLRYDEVNPSMGLIPVGSSFIRTFWQSGDGQPEDKPNGCVVVRVPAFDWINGQVPGGRLQTQNNGAIVPRISVREWDVTAAISGQLGPQFLPLGGFRGFGLVLAGGPGMNELTADDSTNCISDISNITIEVTYTVPPDGGPFVPPH